MKTEEFKDSLRDYFNDLEKVIDIAWNKKRIDLLTDEEALKNAYLCNQYSLIQLLRDVIDDYNPEEPTLEEEE